MDRQAVLDAVNNLMDAINSKMESLAAEDKKQCLNSSSETKGKDTVVFPDIFSGNLGDNVYKFIKDFKEAISESQVKKSDQVKTLQKYLGREAKKRCGEHYPNLESALLALTEYYGNATLIWTKTKDEFKSSFTNSA